MMNEIFVFIAENKALQAVSIIAALGTLVAFVWKNFKSAYLFISDIAKGGIRRAQRSVAREALRRARIDRKSYILVITRIILSILTISRLFNLIVPFFSIMLLVFIYNREPIDIPSLTEFLITIPIGFILVTIAFWYTYKPFLILWNYIFIVRRHEFHRLRQATKR